MAAVDRYRVDAGSDGIWRESAIAAVRALALRVAADCIDHGAEIPEPFMKVFSVA